MHLRTLFFTVILSLVLSGNAYAYIDPGTGGYVFSALGPILVMAAGALSFVFRPVRKLFGSIFGFFRRKQN
jgi:hypothetical protein